MVFQSSPVGRSTLLERRIAFWQTGASNYPLSFQQQEMDQLGHGFVASASDWRSLTAMTLGGFAYQIGKLATMGAASPTLSVLAGLGLEVATFRSSQALLQGRGLREAFAGKGFLSTTLDFALLKGAGKLMMNQSVVLAHAIQSGTMVLGHELGASLNLVAREEASLPQKLIQAEVINIQMLAGIGLLHKIFPSIASLECAIKIKNSFFSIEEIRDFAQIKKTDSIFLMSGQNGKVPSFGQHSLSKIQILRIFVGFAQQGDSHAKLELQTIDLSELEPQLLENIDLLRDLANLGNKSAENILRKLWVLLPERDVVSRELDSIFGFSIGALETRYRAVAEVFKRLYEKFFIDCSLTKKYPLETLLFLAERGNHFAFRELSALAIQHSYVLRPLLEKARQGHVVARLIIKNIDIERLSRNVESGETSAFAFRYLAEFGSEKAYEAYLGFAVKNSPFVLDLLILSLELIGEEYAWCYPKLVEAVRKNKALRREIIQLAKDNQFAQEILTEIAPDCPEAIFTLRMLVAQGNTWILEKLMRMDVQKLKELGHVDSDAVETLFLLEIDGNKQALPALAELAPWHPRARYYLNILAFQGDCKALFALARILRPPS